MRRSPAHFSPRRNAFTLIEVLLVLAILGVLAAMVVPQVIGQQKTAYIKTTKANISSLENILKSYAINHDGEYPQASNAEAFNILRNPGTDAQGRPQSPYLEKAPKDAWGKELFYEWPNTKNPNAEKPAIWSSGPDKINADGSGDDINNWSDAVNGGL